MAAPAISTVDRYWVHGTIKWYFVPSMSNYQAPTRGELDAGTDLTGEVHSSEGWTTTGEDISTPDGDSTFTGTIPGPITAEESSLTVYADPSGSDVRDLLPRGTSGYMVRLGGGDTSGRKMDVFPVRVKTVGKLMQIGENEAARCQIMFSITREPAEDVTIPA